MQDGVEHSIGQLKAWEHKAQSEARARVFLVHGLGEHSGRHLATASALAARGFEVVRFDQRGCGHSGGRRQWIDRFEDYVDDLRAVMSWAQATRAALPTFLFGHSLGGAIVLHAAAAAPRGSLRGIIVTAPAFRIGRGVSAVKVRLGKLLARVAPGAKIPDTLEVAAISRDPEVVAAFRQDPYNAVFNTLQQGNEILVALEQIPDVCKRISTPVLIAHGDADRLIKIEGSREIQALLGSTDKTLHVYPGAYHELHNDLVRDEFLTNVCAWLDSRV